MTHNPSADTPKGTKTLYISDLDGTLLGSDSQLSERSIAMLTEAISRGALFSVATARTPATVSGLLKDLPLTLPAVVMTGVSLWHPVSNQYSHTQFMTPEAAHSLVEIYRRHGLPTFIYTLRDGRIQVYHIGEMSDIEQEFVDSRATSPYKQFHLGADDFANRLAEGALDNVLLFYAMQPNAPALEAFAETSTVKDINPLLYHDIYGDEIALIEAFPKSGTKAEGIKRLKAATGADRVVVFGDNLNDLPMMREADLAVAVGNAVPEVKEAADIVIGTNLEDAVPRFILEDLESNS